MLALSDGDFIEIALSDGDFIEVPATPVLDRSQLLSSFSSIATYTALLLLEAVAGLQQRHRLLAFVQQLCL